MMKIMYVYILQCSDGTYYTGVTNDLQKRIIQHQRGIDKEAYTYSRRPINLVFHHQFKDPDQAIAFEKRVKRWSRKKKEALIDEKWELLPELSKKEFAKRE